MAQDSVLIVGGGVSGLSTAYFLSKLGIRSTIIEKQNRLGGLIKTDLIEGCQLEAGPDSYLAAKPAVSELARELPELRDQIIGSNDAARRIFVARKSRLVPMPKGMAMMVPGQWKPALTSPLFSFATKLRLVTETLMQPRERTEDIAVGQLVEEHFGSEMLEYVAEPLLCGVYGGESEKLSARSVLPRFAGYEQKYGSLIKGVRQEMRDKPQPGPLFLSFRGGMETLTQALAKAVLNNATVIYGEVTKLERSDTGWRVRLGSESISGRDVVLACPAHVSAKLIENAASSLAAELAAIPYSSAIVAMLVYDRATLGHPLDGFGFLVPSGERKTVAAGTWINTKFPSRVREGLAALRAFIVGQNARNLLEASKLEIVDLVRDDYRRLMGITAQPSFWTVYAWPDSMPQYVVGHDRRLERINEAAKQYSGLYLVGNAYDGVGIADCLRHAKEKAKQIESRRP